ncbi:MAG: hypothetical protein QOF73_4049 [Thermomicrobiales bacterium]|nr:hypothetical protein [Thermomicrobiales bacterium]
MKSRPRAIRRIKALNTFADIAAEVGGRSAGAVIGFQVGGVEGAIAGATSGSIATRTLRATAVEFVSRTLSKREMQRAATAWGHAVRRIEERQKAGERPREDGFFDDDLTERAAAKEIAEGLLIAAQRQHEERKLRYLGNLYANLVFSPILDRGSANAVLRQAEELSYRQFCVLAISAKRQRLGSMGEHRLRIPWNQLLMSKATPINTLTVLDEIMDMQRRSLVEISEVAHGHISNVITVQKLGGTLFDLLELEGIERSHLAEIEALIDLPTDAG